MLEAALGDGALGEELAWNTAASTTACGIERKWVGFGRVPEQAVLVWARIRRLASFCDAVRAHVFGFMGR